MLMSLIKSWLNLMSNILWSLSHLQGIGSSIPVDAKILRYWGPCCRRTQKSHITSTHFLSSGVHCVEKDDTKEKRPTPNYVT